jgi:heterodisulfide reductase subunit A
MSDNGKERIGVYVCRCGTNISHIVDVEDVARFAAGLPGVVVAKEYKYMCSEPGQELIQKDIEEQGLNRVVVSSCSPLMHEVTFRGAVEDAGMNPYLFQMTNIREHCSWVHDDTVRATEKAKRLIRAAVFRVARQRSLEQKEVPVHPDAMVVGAGIAGIEAALRLADSGRKVYLVEKQPSIGGHMAMFDKTFPTMDCAACILTPKMVTVGQHPNIELLSYSEVEEVAGFVGNFKVKVRRKASYVTKDCNGCSDCTQVCPVAVPNEFEQGHADRKAVYRLFPQAVPNTFTITKQGVSPCKIACPADCNAHGYVALASVGKFAEGLAMARERVPFPGILGRVCNHPCEKDCNRGEVDQPLSIAAVKRFLADWEVSSGAGYAPELPVEERQEKVAVVGGGPAGLTAAQDLRKLGLQVTLFDAAKKLGGVMRSHIPHFRLPEAVVDREVANVRKWGFEVKTGVALGKDVTLDGLLSGGYGAVILATGATKSTRMDIPGIESEGVFFGMDVLEEANRGGRPNLGKKVVVVGGGNVAMDVARTALRLGADSVHCFYRRTEREMPAEPTEIEEAREEGVRFEFLTAPVSLRRGDDGRLVLRCIRMELGAPDASGRRRPVPIEGSEFETEADSMITAIGQTADVEVFKKWGLETSSWGSVVVDPVTGATNKEGVFAAGDLVRGPASIVEAIADGHRAAESADRFIRGVDLAEGRILPEPEKAPVREARVKRPRVRMPSRPIQGRLATFDEVNFGLTEEMVTAEVERCLNCAVCSECRLCETKCEAKAINHSMTDTILEMDVGAIIVATGFEPFDVRETPQYGWERFPDVLTGLEFERLCNASGYTDGHILTADGREPRAVAILHCIGSRDEKHNAWCSRVCCMYSLKFAFLVKDHTPAEVYDFYIDMRAFGKGYEEFYKRLLAEGVHFIRGKAAEVTDAWETPEEKGRLVVVAEDTLLGGTRRVPVDMVILSGGLKPRADADRVAKTFHLSCMQGQFFLEKHPKLAPVDTASDGIYIAGACQGAKDIPDSVAQGAAAAAAALSLLDKGKVVLEPIKCAIDEELCSGCKLCIQNCPYLAIVFDAEKKISVVTEELCKGCGTCVAGCPSGAAGQQGYEDEQILAEVEGMLT